MGSVLALMVGIRVKMLPLAVLLALALLSGCSKTEPTAGPKPEPAASPAGEQPPAPPAGTPPARAALPPEPPVSESEPKDRRTLLVWLAKKAQADPASSKELSDDEFLDLIARRTFDCFWYEADPDSHLIPDSTGWRTHASVAGIGYQLGALIVGHSRRYRDPDEIYRRVEAILDNCWDDPDDPKDMHLENHSGHPYHWVNIKTGRWDGQEGVCTHDTVNYLCGVIAAKNYFAGTRAAGIAQKILDAVDWKWLEHGVPNRRFLSNMYARTDKDQTGPGDVRFYDGMKFDYILPIGWKQNNVEPRYWDHWAMDYPWDHYKYHYWRIERPALWCHQWDSVWFDFRGLKDEYADYHHNSIEAALANRQWCIDNNSYSAQLWGINPCAGPKGYGNFGAPPDELPFQNGADNDGTITPTAALPCIVWTPREAIDAARAIYDGHREKVWRWFGFVDSLNPSKNWFCRDWIAIDQGPILLNIENHRTGLIHRMFEKEPSVWNGLRLCGFVGVVDNFDPSEHSPPYAQWSAENCAIARDSEQAKEAVHSLKITPTVSGRATLTARPERTDISPFRRLAFWLQGAEEPRVSIRSGGKTTALEEARINESILGWKRLYFDLPPAAKSVDEVRFEFDELPESGARLDDIVWTHEVAGRESRPLIDDFSADGEPPARWKAVKNASLRQTREKALAIVLEKPGEQAVVEAAPRFRDWRKGHSLALRVRGEASVRVELIDAAGKKGYVDALDSGPEWRTLHFNIQANFYPNTLNLKYDKQQIAGIRLTVLPKDKRVKEVLIDDVFVTD